MAAENPPGVLQNLATHSARTLRRMLHGLVMTEGIWSPAHMAVTQLATPAMKVQVAMGGAYVYGDNSVGQGTYETFNDGSYELTIAEADGANPRKDLVVAQVKDAFEDAGGSNLWTPEVVAGNPAASPLEPDLPDNAVLLAVVTVGAGVSSITDANIADRRPRATALGGTVVCTSTIRPASPFEGMRIYEIDTDLEYIYNGSDWKHYAGVATGSVTPATGWDSTGEVVRQGQIVTLTVLLTRTGGNLTGSTASLGTVPSGFRPASSARFQTAYVSNGNIIRLRVGTDGDITPSSLTLVTSNSVTCELSYRVA